ncbi:MAG: hypothetical protein IT535_00690 [Bauldia sp.]|nr:hypothetical protein [Bauldia sp.]
MDLEFFHVFFIVGAAVIIVWWLVVCFRPGNELVRARDWRLLLFAALLVSVAILLYVLTTWASFDVIRDPYYITGYAALGIVWVFGTVSWLGAFTDIRLNQDVRAHNNFAAATLIACLTTATTLAYSGGNIGNGPGRYVVVFSALLSTAAVYSVGFAVATATESEERITIDHDLGAAIRLGGAMIATGLVAGRAVAGDWVSVGATVADFIRFGWPVVLIGMVAVTVERIMPPAYLSAGILRSLAIFAVQVGAATIYVANLGRW